LLSIGRPGGRPGPPAVSPAHEAGCVKTATPYRARSRRTRSRGGWCS